ncbi:TetR family transcriptional regulator [Nocardioides immobilis]|uniref:TetR family transcriptional regulator n=1 Tax=Nocardioides immobilis TaxID=2049295 RepID=A0A417XUI9_9ACTN|nr:TetR family transcriptional regulator [Nocardioides immobilis]RHW24006.1 TetR family transcriptional regulator [Nocardioides immobilis]
MSAAHKGDSRDSPLTEGEIVEAALRLIKQDGVDGLSMRRLSKELGRSHMAMYYWVPDKAALLDLVASAALRDIPVPIDAGQGWAARLRALIGSIDVQLRANPGLGGILLDRMLSTDRRILNAAMDILVDAGFDDADVLMAYATVHTYLFGRYQLVTAPPPASEEEAEDTVARLVVQLPRLTGRDYFEFGVDTLIAGLRDRLDDTPRE